MKQVHFPFVIGPIVAGHLTNIPTTNKYARLSLSRIPKRGNFLIFFHSWIEVSDRRAASAET